MKKYLGMDYLRIDIAGQWGLDKETFNPRITWVHENEDSLEANAEDADDFFRYVAAVEAYRKAQRKEPVGHLVGLDACASGPQILSVIVGCEVGARNTGAIGKVRADLYTTTTDTMRKELGNMAVFTRSEVKSALMPLFYGSIKQPENVFGKDTDELEAFYNAAEAVCPGAFMLLPIMSALWDPTVTQYVWPMPDGFVVRYMVKDKVDRKIEVDTLESHPTFIYRREINTTLESAVKLPANITQSIDGYIVRELSARCNYDREELQQAQQLLINRINTGMETNTPYIRSEAVWRKHKAISLAGAEYITESQVNRMSLEYTKVLLSLVQRTLEKPSFEVISVHDEFKCLPNYMNHVRQTYIDILAELADSNILNVILSAIAKRKINIKKLSNNLSTLIREAHYPIA